jgi:hypothetical protein
MPWLIPAVKRAYFWGDDRHGTEIWIITLATGEMAEVVDA